MAWNEPGGNDNDPWGNRKNSGGPPDLDDVFKNIKKWFADLSGKPGGSGNGGGGASRGQGLPGGNLSGKGLGLIAAVLVGLWLLSGIYLIQPAQAGVVTQFGKHVRTTTPGPHWRIPWPVQQVEKLDVEQIRTTRLTDQLILTQDENMVDIDLAVQYNIKSAENFLFKVRGPDETLETVVESALREVIGSTLLDSVLTTGSTAVWSSTKDELQKVLDDYEAGITVTSVSLERAQPPEEVQAAFSDAIKAREDKERFINEAEAYMREILPRARGDAQRYIEESEAYKTRVVQAATGESRRFLSLLEEFKKAPDVTRDRLYLESMEQVLGNTSKVLVDNDSGNSLMYLPIDKLIEQRGGTTTSSTNDRSPTGGSIQPLDRSGVDALAREVLNAPRETGRSRDRGALR